MLFTENKELYSWWGSTVEQNKTKFWSGQDMDLIPRLYVFIVKIGLASITEIMQEKIVRNILYNMVYYLFIKL